MTRIINIRSCCPAIMTICLVAVGCTSDSDRRAVDGWLLCEECVDDELQTVVQKGDRWWIFGERVVRTLSVALRGPDRDRVDMKRAHFTASYAELSAHAVSQGRPVPLSEADYVGRRLSNYEASYQERSAIALGKISKSSAADALRRALRRDSLGLAAYRPDVLAAIHRALYEATDTVTWAAIGAGGLHTCGIATSGDLYCWGRNDEGQLGDASFDDRIEPTPVAGHLNATTVSSGMAHTCAVTQSGDGYCWGLGTSGQLGDGTMTSRNTAERVDMPAGATFSAIAADSSHTCAISNFSVYCWGENGDGQLGDGTNTAHATPDTVPGYDATTVSAGWAHTCADTLGANRVYCWGSNDYGQLGTGTPGSEQEPVAAFHGFGLAAIGTGQAHTCGLTPVGEAYCWGSNSVGQLGDGTTVDNGDGVLVQGGHTFSFVTAGLGHTCALTPAGEAYCWGDNGAGQLGIGSTVNQTEPIAVHGSHSFATLSAGLNHTCGITMTRLALCWGAGGSGEIGDGGDTDRLEPVFVSNPPVP